MPNRFTHLPAAPTRPALSRPRNLALGLALALPVLSLSTSAYAAQAAPAATPAARQIGTVRSIEGNTLTLTTDAGAQVTVTVAPTARVLQLPPGSTDLKAAQVAAISDVAVGDRVLVTGAPGDSAAQFSANRVILMKSGAIAQKHESEQADWQRRGTGGIVSAIDPATGTLTVSAGARKLQVVTSSTTIFRRYAGDSVKFEDAKLGTVSQIEVGDQLRVRGGRSQTDSGTTVQAEEIVSGSFKNLSGTLLTVDASSGRITLKDLTTKRNMTVEVTPHSEVHALPPEAAARFAARERGGSGAGSGGGSAGASSATHAAGTPAGGGAAPASAVPSRSRPASESAAASAGTSAAGTNADGAPHPGADGASGGPGAGGRSAGGDLSQLVARLPLGAVTDLHPGEAVMIVASSSTPTTDSFTAVTLLTGVEPILAAAPAGSSGAMTLSPWSVGGSSPEGGGGEAGGGGGAPR